ncbi:MAG TPA: hypothetical protein VLL94_06005 [Nitrospiraceae bacterium]|nr:hypothetical protein [Nitrospiraceae bacterium]
MKHSQFLIIGLLGVFLATGCAGKGERIDLSVPIASGVSVKAATMSSATVEVQPFEDHRTDRSHLGTRFHLWGGESYFGLPNSTLGEATAQAFADYLKRKGWNAAVARGNGTAGADVIITGRLMDVGVDAKSGIGQTVLHAKSRMVVQVQNQADGSQVRETLTGVGDNQVFWFEPEDAQELLNELYNKNFEKFVADTRLDGKILKLR